MATLTRLRDVRTGPGAIGDPQNGAPTTETKIEAALLTGGGEPHYTFGLAESLISRDVRLEVIGGNAGKDPNIWALPNLNYLNLRGDQSSDASFARKLARVLIYYVRLAGYTWVSKPKIFHILWNNKFQFFDRTFLMLYYKAKGKKIVLTAHNVNAGRRDAEDNLLNRLSLRLQYQLADHIFVHTEKMRCELIESFGVQEKSVTVIPHGINNAVRHTEMTRSDARHMLGIKDDERTILSFGIIRPYKGLEFLTDAFQRVTASQEGYRLIIAGQIMKGHEKYWEEIRLGVEHLLKQGRVILKLEHIPDNEIEVYFKAADVLVLPYTEIFQSGVLLLAYSFGLPVIATEVGSFRDDIIDGKTGFLCKPCDSADLARTTEIYFQSNLFKDLMNHRHEIRSYAEAHYSWGVVGTKTLQIYAELSRGGLS